MNTLFLVVLLAGVGASCAGLTDLIPGFCNVDADCGTNMCCLGGRFCSLQLQANFPCMLTSYHKCGCTDGLDCKITMSFTVLGKTFNFRQCRAANVSATPGSINVDSDGEPVRRRKRGFLPDINITRSCNNERNCGVDRCCSSLTNLCSLLIPEHFPCKTSGCCRLGLECKVTYTLYNPLTGKKLFDVKQCKRASAPSEIQALEVTED